MVIPGRKYRAGSGYRYGFNGKENDPETYGEGNVYDYGFRIYNPRLGRFLSVDPLQEKYPELTPYQFASNSPIQGVDLDGREIYHYTMTMNSQGQAALNLKSTTYKHAHSFLGLYWETKIDVKRYIVDYDGKSYHIGFAQYGTGYANAWKAEEFENDYIKKQGNAVDFGFNYVDDDHSRAGSDAALVVNAQNFGAETAIPFEHISAPKKITNKSSVEVHGGNTGAIEANTGGISLKNSNPQQGPGFKLYNTKIADGKVSMITAKGVVNTTGRYDFVITNDGKLVIGTGHYKLSGGATNVQAAGQIKIVNGQLREITNSSGHYKPTIAQGEQAVNLLQNMGVNTSGSRVSIYGEDGSLNKTYIKK